MTADEALAWIEEHDAFVVRDPSNQPKNLWAAHTTIGVDIFTMGPTFIEAVTRLKAKLEAGK